MLVNRYSVEQKKLVIEAKKALFEWELINKKVSY